jgi:large subunit ribosomal protein L21
MKDYAIIQFAGKQFKVHEGDIFDVERQPEVLENQVLFYSYDDEKMVGKPEVEDVVVKLLQIEEKRGKKVLVARFKSKSRYRKSKSHRQPLSTIKVEKITFKSAISSALKEEKAEDVKNDKKVVPAKKDTKVEKTTKTKKTVEKAKTPAKKATPKKSASSKKEAKK